MINLIRCRDCENCKPIGRQKSNRYTIGRKRYWCEHPVVGTLDSKVFGNKAEGFIGFGENNYQSPLVLKTTPKWCPMKK